MSSYFLEFIAWFAYIFFSILSTVRSTLDSLLGAKMIAAGKAPVPMTTIPNPPASGPVVGSQKRKRKKNSQEEREVVSSTCKLVRFYQ